MNQQPHPCGISPSPPPLKILYMSLHLYTCDSCKRHGSIDVQEIIHNALVRLQITFFTILCSFFIN